MRILLGVILLIFGSLYSAVVNAQPVSSAASDFNQFFEPALRQLGVYATAPVKENVRRAAAADFTKGAMQAGFVESEIKSFSTGMITGEIRVSPGGKNGTVTTGDARLRIGDEPAKGDYLLSFRSVQTVGAYLERFSTIKIVVKPAPPRDYSVVINDEPCPTTEEGIYKVLPGSSKVNVSRAKKPKCDWQGLIGAGAVQLVECKL